MMKNSVLFVLGTLWSFSILIGQSTSSALNSDGSDDGAVVAGRSRRLNIPRDLSDHPIIDRVTRNTDDQGDPSPKFNHLILIVPAILGVAMVAFIVGLVCYQMQRSGTNRCISNECLIWCGVMKREPRIDRSVYHPVVEPQGGFGTRRDGPSVAVTRHPDKKNLACEWVEQVEEYPLRAIPSEKSSTLGDTPTTDVSVLTIDEEGRSPESLAEGQRNVTTSKKTRFPFSNAPSTGVGERVTNNKTSSTKRLPVRPLDFIQEAELVKGNKTGGRDKGREGSSDDDDVFKKDDIDNLVDSGVSSEDAVDKPLVGQKGIRRKRAKATESIKPGGYRKCPSENSPNTKELEAAVTKVQQPPDNPGFIPEEHSSHSGGSKDPPYTVPITDKHFRYGHVEHLHVKVIGDANFDLSRVSDMQVGDRQTDIHHHCRPPPPEQDQHSRPFDRNNKGRQTR